MPYISHDKRRELTNRDPLTPGELNYLISTLITNYWFEHGQNYASINDILGALEGAKLEFYRRVAVPYEDVKQAENGDVYY